MLNLFLFISVAFVFTFVVGWLLEKIRVPWIFAALLFGTMLAVYNPFQDVTSSETFGFLSELGMLFLLFMIGFQLNLKEMNEKKGFFIKSTLFIIFLEGLLGSLVIHFVFGYEWFMSILVALSFATVGEAILIPILDEFKIVNTKLGQTIIGIGTLDDIIEIGLLIITVFLIGSGVTSHFDAGVIIFSLLVLFVLFVSFEKLKLRSRKFRFVSIESAFLFTIFVFFLFVGIGQYSEAMPLAALLAGISLNTFIPESKLKFIESEIKTMSYGFFAPLFFISVGASVDISYLISFPLLVLLVVAVSNGAKLLGSYIMARKELGTKQSILLGIGLSVRFSTSIIIVKILFDNGLIGNDLFSIIIASSIVFKFLVPVLFSTLIVKWNVVPPQTQGIVQK